MNLTKSPILIESFNRLSTSLKYPISNKLCIAINLDDVSTIIDIYSTTNIKDIDLAESMYETPLIYAIATLRLLYHPISPDYIDTTVIETILQFDKDSIDKIDRSGYSAMHYAVMNGYLNCIELLYEHGSKVAMDSSNINNVACTAAYHGKVDALLLLIKLYGKEVISISYDHNIISNSVFGQHHKIDTLKQLVAIGIESINIPNAAKNQTPIYHTIYSRSSSDDIKVLASFGADLSVKDHDGKTPLEYAINATIHTDLTNPKCRILAALTVGTGPLLSLIQLSDSTIINNLTEDEVLEIRYSTYFGDFLCTKLLYFIY